MPDALHPKELVLVGGGHAHLAVLQALRRQAWPAVSVTLVTPEPTLCYSGMVPGWLAGHHRSEALHIPLAPLARAAGVRWRQDRVSAVDAARRTVQLASGEALAYDVLSLACGAVVDGGALHGFSGPLLPTRPLEALLAGWPPLKAHLAAHGGHLVVLGGGAAGVELALAARHVLRDARRVPISLVIGAGLLPGHATAGRALVRRACEQAGITLREGRVNQAAGPTL
ncbi:MAG: FAD-dependent oxidoreductase, partial [Candidatus Sericytochromatia bacterium]|nr:FAD-dependent oxidoreductase [Candidatus Sericytochromatia bacterium]